LTGVWQVVCDVAPCSEGRGEVEGLGAVYAVWKPSETMKFDLRWTDIGRPTEPGDYRFRGGIVSITIRHIEQWQRNPDGVWEVASSVGARGTVRYALRTFRWKRYLK
jgi:hypothetical protein